MSDVLIATDGGGFFRSYLFIHGTDLYNLIAASPIFPNPTPIKMWKSADGGATWAALASFVSAQTLFNVSGAPCIIGTKMFMYYVPTGGGGVTSLASFDFTTDTFTAIATTSSSGSFSAPFISGAVSTLIYTLNGGASSGTQVGKYTANVWSSIGNMVPTGSYVSSAPEALLLGSSGVLHILYRGGQSPSGLPDDLGYAKVVASVLTGSIGSTIVYSAYSDRPT